MSWPLVVARSANGLAHADLPSNPPLILPFRHLHRDFRGVWPILSLMISLAFLAITSSDDILPQSAIKRCR